MELNQILSAARKIAQQTLAPAAAATDRDAAWPEEGLRSLLDGGLGGLVVPRRYGGLGQGLYGLTRVCEILGMACPSTAMCFGMHAVASAVIAARATPFQVKAFLEPIVQGNHLTTLALSETGTGAHFYFPQTRVERIDDEYEITGQKSFITNGGHADSYVTSVTSPEIFGPGMFSCIVVPAGTNGLDWGDPWLGMGMRGNASRVMRLDRVRVPASHLLGAEGDQIWFTFEVVAPYFLTAMAGVYLGVAARALELAIAHLKGRRYQHHGMTLAQSEVLQHRLGELWADVEKTRSLAYVAAQRFDEGDARALPAVLSTKAEVAECCVRVTNQAMTFAGGKAYGENADLARLLRDARAAHVMAPTTDILRTWVGRSLLGEPLLVDESR